LGDLLDDVGAEAARSARDVQVGMPADGVQATVIEAVEDDTHPLRRAAQTPGDVAVADAAGGQQEDAGALGVDGVFALAFHPAEFLLLVRAERAYLNFVHGPSPRLSMVAHHNVETVFIPSPHATELNNQSQLNTKRTDWTRH